MIRLLSLMLVIVSGSLILGILSCSSKDTIDPKPDFPEKIITAAEDIIMKSTGAEFFNKYITPDTSGSRPIPEGYFISYRFYMPERPYIDEKITFGLDTTGALIKDIPVTGIPDCASAKENCTFLVGEKDARKIAEEGGLSKGIKEWGMNFNWNTDYKKYVWSIITTLQGSDGPNGFRGNGIEMIIDPNSGEILTQSEWNVR